MVNNPLVSIILPTYNGNHSWLSESIDSVLSQSFSSFELIIINDSSTNDIEKTILEYKQKDNRIVYKKNEKNLGLTKSLNKGIKESKGKYIARIDDDDIWCDANKLKKQVEFMENNPDYGLCGTGCILIDENGKEKGLINFKENNQDIKNNILINNQFIHSSVLFINLKLEYPLDARYCEDYGLWLNLGKIKKMVNLNSIKIKYRLNGKSISNKNKLNQICFSTIQVVKHRNDYNSYYKGLLYWTKVFFINLITHFIKKLGLYSFLSPLWRKYILKQK